jgi:hypothetical protein
VRWFEPKLIALGIVLISLGAGARIVFFDLLPPIDWGDPVPQAVSFVQQPGAAALRKLPALSVPANKVKEIVPGEQIGRIVPDCLAALDRDGRLPANIKFTEMSPDRFWRNRWPIESLAVASGNGVKLVGAIVLPGQTYDGSLLRWIGIFRKVDKHWVFASLREPGLATLDGYPAVRAADVPVTLASVLPFAGDR